MVVVFIAGWTTVVTVVEQAAGSVGKGLVVTTGVDVIG